MMTVLTGGGVRLDIYLRQVSHEHDAVAEDFEIPYGSSVRVLLRQGSKIIGGPITCLRTHIDADWDAGHIVAEAASEATTFWSSGTASVEVDIVTGVRRDKWLSGIAVRVVKGMLV